jgi:hypothetical protein
LEAAKESLRLESERVEQYKDIARSSEEKLAEFNSSYDQYKAEMDQKLSDSEVQDFILSYLLY